jgi:hypothetical protein
VYAPGLTGIVGAASEVVATAWRKTREAYETRAAEKTMIAKARKGTRSEQPA